MLKSEQTVDLPTNAGAPHSFSQFHKPRWARGLLGLPTGGATRPFPLLDQQLLFRAETSHLLWLWDSWSRPRACSSWEVESFCTLYFCKTHPIPRPHPLGNSGHKAWSLITLWWCLREGKSQRAGRDEVSQKEENRCHILMHTCGL